MVTFYEMNFVGKMMILCFVFVLLIFSINNVIVSIRKVNKKNIQIRSIIISFLIFIFLVLILLNMKIEVIDDMDDIDIQILKTPLICYTLAIFLFLMIVIYDTASLSEVLHYRIGDMAIKESVDELPTSICYYNQNGLILLSNNEINEDANIVMGHRLLNGINFWNTLNYPNENAQYEVKHKADEVIVIYNQGKVKSYKKYVHKFDKEEIYEIIGSDITEEYNLYDQYEKKKEQLQVLNVELKQYGDDVIALTTEKEIFNTKIKIHNDLGKLLLQTKVAIEQNEDKEELLRLWKENMQLLSLINRDNQKSNRIDDLIKAAQDIGVSINYSGYKPRPSTPEENVIGHAIHICLTNTVSHGNGNVMNVNCEEKEDVLEVIFTNNGENPKGNIKEGGGLSSLRALVEKEKGTMEIIYAPTFGIKLTLRNISERR